MNMKELIMKRLTCCPRKSRNKAFPNVSGVEGAFFMILDVAIPKSSKSCGLIQYNMVSDSLQKTNGFSDGL